jgi:hypothetical protein
MRRTLGQEHRAHASGGAGHEWFGAVREDLHRKRGAVAAGRRVRDRDVVGGHGDDVRSAVRLCREMSATCGMEERGTREDSGTVFGQEYRVPLVRGDVESGVSCRPWNENRERRGIGS